ncbi:Tetrathionate reductase subunit A [Neomoorella glycerini]|uniref:Tetrathionate reductase subunit A n=1 Tax=Neomoorella glycerini TaxID=55779 RepID=A0A6I5ZVI2_9FIRM|nr:Tetrathionate reductase subunit A [Moorella glycerini]
MMSGGAVGPGEKAEWVPIKPTTDGALIMAMICWMFANNSLDYKYLAIPNMAAAQKEGYYSYTNSTYLVIIDPGHPNYRKLLRPEDLGWTNDGDEYIVIDRVTGQPAKNTGVEAGELFFSGVIQNNDGQSIKVTTALNILKENAYRYSMEDYARICGVPKEKIEELAREYTSHGYKVGVDGMGNLAAANGFYTGMALYLLSALMGSWNLRGGMIKDPQGYAAFGRGPRYDLNTISDAPRRSGVRLSRDFPYEYTTEYQEKVKKGENPYPSKLPWYPLNSSMDNQAVYSIINEYPYKAKILVSWMANLFFATPGAAREEIINEFKNPERIPLIIAIDPFMGEVAAVADYVLPDTTQYESWGLLSIYGYTGIKATSIRWPVVRPPMQEIGPGRYPCFETYIIDVAKKIGLPGFGDDAIKDVTGNSYPLNNPEDYFLKAVVNVAYDENPVPEISPEEYKLQEFGKVFFNVAGAIKNEEWPRAAYVMARGGRFAPYDSDWKGERQKDAYTGVITIYNETVATSRNSMTGEFFAGTACWQPEVFADGKPVDEAFNPDEWPFKLVNCKAKLRSISLIANAPVVTDLSSTNYIEINSLDAGVLGLKTGTKVKLVAATGGEVTGELLVRPGIARGTVNVYFGYGHWAYGARGYQVGEKKVAGDASRGGGIMAGKVSPLDKSLQKVFGLSDLATGVPARNGGRYKIVRV